MNESIKRIKDTAARELTRMDWETATQLILMPNRVNKLEVGIEQLMNRAIELALASQVEAGITIEQAEIFWHWRYSDNEEADKFNRWARIAYFNERQIAWVNRIIHESKSIYTVHTNFPVYKLNDSPGFNGHFETFEQAKEKVTELWAEFCGSVSSSAVQTAIEKERERILAALVNIRYNTGESYGDYVVEESEDGKWVKYDELQSIINK